MHKGGFEDWCECRRMMCTWFGKPKMRLTDKYDGQDNPWTYLAKWMPTYGKQPMWIRMNSTLRGMVNKLLFRGKCTVGS